MEKQLQSRIYGALTLCARPEFAIDTSQWSLPASGGKLTPDGTSAYLTFKLGGSWPGRTAYGTALHPGTAANSHRSLLHKQLNDRHMLRAHSESPQARNHFIGAVVALDYPRTPHAGWKMNADPASAPIITAAGTLFKQADEVPEILKEHLGGIHQWSVSQELYHTRSASGWLVEMNAQNKLTPAQRELCLKNAPEDFRALNLGYIPWDEAPADLLKCYDEEKQMVSKPWQNCQLTLICGGINGSVHWGGAAMVPFGAEYEAEVMQLLAAHPGRTEAEKAPTAAYNNFFVSARKSVDALREACSTKPQRTD